jgi:hypothetical protein
MRKTFATLVLAASFVGVPAMVGCDRTVSREETVTKKSDGSTKVKEETVTKKADGSLETKKEEKKVNNP